MRLGNPLFDRVLLTNDDGIHAPGLLALEKIAADIAGEVWVVAPAHDQSGVSHAISLHDPLRVKQLGERRFEVQGTPGDCVVLAVRHLMDRPPTLILSGVNRGANIGMETVFSGTVGAAMSGMLLGIASIAMSQAFTHGEPIEWETATALGPEILSQACATPWPRDCCLNINFPDCESAESKGILLTSQGKGRLDNVEVHARLDPRNQEYFWLSLARTDSQDDPGSETFGLCNRYVTVTPLSFERTHWATLKTLAEFLPSD